MSLLKSLTFDKIPICLDEITKLSFQVGTIFSVKPVIKARKPSYEMEAWFDERKKSCGQFTRNYKEEELIGKQIIGLTNLPFVRIAGIKSEYLTLGFADEMGDGQAIPLTPSLPVKNGARILLPDTRDELNFDETRQAEYKDFESVNILSATIVDIKISAKSGEHFCIVDFGKQKIGVALVIGKLKGDLSDYLGIQIPVICNLDYEREGCILANEAKLVAFSLPVDSTHSTLVKVDKPVKNGLSLF